MCRLQDSTAALAVYRSPQSSQSTPSRIVQNLSVATNADGSIGIKQHSTSSTSSARGGAKSSLTADARISEEGCATISKVQESAIILAKSIEAYNILKQVAEGNKKRKKQDSDEDREGISQFVHSLITHNYSTKLYAHINRIN